MQLNFWPLQPECNEKHLLAQLENGIMTPFPQQTKLSQTWKRSYTSLPIILQMPAGCHFSEMIRRKIKNFSWRFVQFAENGTTWDVKIFLWPSFVTTKKLLYGNAQNVNKSRNMPNRTFLLNFEVTTHWWGIAHATNIKRARHIWKVILANLEIKFKKSFFSSESSQENVHGGVHSWKSYGHCLQLFRKELHYTRLSGFFQLFLNKSNEISCLCLRNVLRKMSMMRFISGTVTDTGARKF